jgi:hypothetical protein
MIGTSKNQADAVARLLAQGWLGVPHPPNLTLGGPIVVKDPSGKLFNVNPDGSVVPITGAKPNA